MCGILGSIDLRSSTAAVAWRRKGLAAMSRRGPDSEGSYVDGPVFLGARRLRIHDLRSLADQPFRSDDRHQTIVFNGAIFNYRSLRIELQKLGHQFKTTSDTEVALYALRQWGAEAFRRFDGMFAIAWYDSSKRRLLLGRDRLGIKPLHIFETPTLFLFASEIKPLLSHPAVPRRLNQRVLPEFLAFQQLMPPDTMFEGIRIVPPGHYMDIPVDNLGDIRTLCYWRAADSSRGAIVEQDVESALLSSLEQCWDADKPVGIQLSGGVDSSLITALSVEKLGRRKVETYSVFFDDSQIKYYLPRSEAAYIEQVCKKYGLSNHHYTFSADDVRPAFAESVWWHEMPLNGASTCLYLLLARQICDKTTVLLTGEGADDIFLGYFSDWKFTDDLLSLFKMFVGAKSIKALFGPAGLESAIAKRRALAEADYLQDMTPTQRASVLTIEGVLHGLLARHDRMFMAHSIEGRPPFCSDLLVGARFGLADKAVHNGTVGKLPLKKLAERYFPHEFVYRKKIGFSAPFGDWCSDPRWWRGYVDRLDLSFLSEFMDTKPIAEWLDLPEDREKWSGQNLNLIFALTNFQLWHEIFFDSADPSDAAAWQQAIPETARA